MWNYFLHENNLQATSAAWPAEFLPAQAGNPCSLLPSLPSIWYIHYHTHSGNICSTMLSPDLQKHRGNGKLLLWWGERSNDNDTFVLGLWDLTLLSAENHLKEKNTNIKQNKRQMLAVQRHFLRKHTAQDPRSPVRQHCSVFRLYQQPDKHTSVPRQGVHCSSVSTCRVHSLILLLIYDVPKLKNILCILILYFF